jgi:hypothetical protein
MPVRARFNIRLIVSILLAIVLFPYISSEQTTSTTSAHATPLKPQSIHPASATETYTTDQEEQDNRKLAFAWRELEVSGALSNWNLLVENDRLENQIADLQGGDPNQEKFETDKAFAARAKEASEIQSAFTDFWFVSRDAVKQNQSREAESRFDGAIKKCFPEEQDSVTSLAKANQNCHDLYEINTLIEPMINKNIASISLFHEPTTAHPTAAQRLMSEDSTRMRLDTSSKKPSNAKKMILVTDIIVLNTDRQLRIIEWNDSMVARHNRAHPDHLLANDSALHDHLLKLRSTMLSLNERTRSTVARIH